MSDEQERKKDEAVREVTGAKEDAARVESLANDLARDARFVGDIAEPTHDALSAISAHALSPEQWEAQIRPWRRFRDAAAKVEGALRQAGSFGALSFSAASTSSNTIAMIVPAQPYQVLSNDSQAARTIEAAVHRFNQVVDRTPVVAKLRSDIQRLRLDTRLLDEATASLERPSVTEGGGLAVLLALRECIEATFAELLRRRPHQERAKGLSAKVSSLGTQCARPDLPSAHFENLGRDGEQVMDALSGAKQNALTRPEIEASFRRGILFLAALLLSLDEKRVKPGRNG
jgi:hypothetical protein